MSFTQLFKMSNANANSFQFSCIFLCVYSFIPFKSVGKEDDRWGVLPEVKLIFAPVYLYCICFHPNLIYRPSEMNVCSRLLVSHPNPLYLLALDGETQEFNRAAVHLSPLKCCIALNFPILKRYKRHGG